MTNLSLETCLKIKEARRAAKLSQSVLAAEVGCKQSALSMFEQGDGTKLNETVVERLAKKFGISLTEQKATEQKNDSAASTQIVLPPSSRIIGFCPNPHCISNNVYEIDGRTYVGPDRSKADPVGGKFCAICGEVLEKRCPNCGLPVHDGAICSYCGEPYVAVSL